MEFEQHSKVTGNFIHEIEQMENLRGLENIFEIEARLLNYLYEFKKEKSHEQALLIINDLEHTLTSNKLNGLKNYFISLSTLITRHLLEKGLTPTQALAFNKTSCTLINTKLTEDNAAVIAKELIELFVYILEEKEVPTFGHETVNGVIQFVDNKVESPISVEDIAKNFKVSTSHLSRIFRQHVGVTLVEYINIKKVEEAQYYLRFTSKQISAISSQFYFCNQSYFTRIFKKYVGETPRRFRSHLEHNYFNFTLREKEFRAISGH